MQNWTVIVDAELYIVQLPEHVPTHQVATALAKKLRLPQQEADGTLYVYYLGVDERPLDPQKSLDTLNLSVQEPLSLWRTTMIPPTAAPSYDHLLVRPTREIEPSPALPSTAVGRFLFRIYPSLNGRNGGWFLFSIMLSLGILSCLIVPALLLAQLEEARLLQQPDPVSVRSDPPQRWAVDESSQQLEPDENVAYRLPWVVEDALYTPYLEQVIFLTTQPRALQFYNLETGKMGEFSLWQDGVVDAEPQQLDLSPDGERLLITHKTGERTLLHLDTFIIEMFPVHDPADPLCVVTDGERYCFLPPAPLAESCPLLWADQKSGIDICGTRHILEDNPLPVNPLPDAVLAEAKVRAVFYVSDINRFVMLSEDSVLTRTYDLRNTRQTFFPELEVERVMMRGNGRYLFLHPDQNKITIVAQVILDNGKTIDYMFTQPLN